MSGPQACGCHIYSGGFTTGLMQAGLDVVGQWEEFGDTFGAKTFELNFPQIEHPTQFEDWNPDKVKGIELFYANPPCAVWSAAGSLLGLNDPRLQYTANSMKTGLAVQPEFFILESVPRAWSVNNGARAYYTEWAKEWQKAGYAVTIVLTNALLHGAPQSRERFHFIAHKMKLGLQEPVVYPTDIPTVKDIIGDLEHTAGNIEDLKAGTYTGDPNHVAVGMNEGTLNVIKELQQGEGWDAAYNRLAAKGVTPIAKGRFIAHRLIWDAPCATILDIHSMVHPTQDRFLTIREGARLCGYPDWFKFYPQKGSLTGNASEVTQAVIPYVGNFWGKVFNRALDRAEALDDVDREAITVIDWRPLGKPFFPRRYQNALQEFLAAR